LLRIFWPVLASEAEDGTLVIPSEYLEVVVTNG
jgi:hypothetical protein